MILDVTRLVARVGRPVLGGIDRVEHAYLRAVLNRPGPAPLFLVGTWAGQFLLPAEAGRRLLRWIDDPAAAPRPPLAVRHALGRRAMRANALWLLSRDRLGRAGDGAALAQLLLRLGAAGGWLVSVGHANAAGLAMARTAGLRRAAFVHDTIPLDHPGWAAPAAVAALRGWLAESVLADRVLVNSHATATDLARHMAVPGAALTVAGLGIDGVTADPAGLPRDLVAGAAPVFLCLGTVEPRKDHGFLLDLWQALAAAPPPGPMPRLVLAGRAGWGAGPVLHRLAALAAGGLPLSYLPDLSDTAVAALMDRAAALLAPSRAEGFGLPLAEAAARGVPVLATPLPAFRDAVGDYPFYLPAGEIYPWLCEVRDLCATPVDTGTRRARARPGPTWQDHTDHVLRQIA